MMQQKLRIEKHLYGQVATCPYALQITKLFNPYDLFLTFTSCKNTCTDRSRPVPTYCK